MDKLIWTEWWPNWECVEIEMLETRDTQLMQSRIDENTRSRKRTTSKTKVLMEIEGIKIRWFEYILYRITFFREERRK